MNVIASHALDGNAALEAICARRHGLENGGHATLSQFAYDAIPTHRRHWRRIGDPELSRDSGAKCSLGSSEVAAERSTRAGPVVRSAVVRVAVVVVVLVDAFFIAGRGQGQDRAPTVTVLTVGHQHEEVGAAALRSDLPVRVRRGAVPSAARAIVAVADERVARARDAYIDTEFESCLRVLGPLSGVVDALGADRRQYAARLAFWRIACMAAAGGTNDAERMAQRFATLRLQVPQDVALATPMIEHLLVRAIQTVGGRERHIVRFAADIRGTVRVDALETCSTPCTIELPPGDHVVRFEAAGRVTTVRRIHAESDASVRFEPDRASPDLAAQQWGARYSGAADIESAASVELLTRAVRARNVVLLLSEREGSALQVRGVAAVEGHVAGRASHRGTLVEATDEVLRELLVEAELVAPEPPVVRRAGFWVGIIGAALLAAAVTFAVLYEPNVTREITF